MQLTSWGRYPVVESNITTPRDPEDALTYLTRSKHIIGRGLGRSYGDSALAPEVLSCLGLDHMESFDPQTGTLVAESGVSLADILTAFLPRGWFLPVTPGTKFVTLAGAVASDVHGKDHHIAGTFSNHVEWFDIWTPQLGLIRCSSSEHADIFNATCGGMGLTGFIVRVAVRLVRVPSAFIAQDVIKAKNLTEIMEIFEQSGHYPFSVAWIDCLTTGEAQGRSVLMAGKFARMDELKGSLRMTPHQTPQPHAVRIPFDFPSYALNTFSVRAFNALYYAKAPKGKSHGVVSYNSFFYPLDALHHWNRIYGRRGFTQYQFVIPREASSHGLPRILSRIAAAGQGSFLAVLKLFGAHPERTNSLSFPREGYTLALDFAVNQKLFPLLNELDAMVLDFGGRHYLTKDCRLTKDTLQKGYGEKLDQFKEVRERVDPNHIFGSVQSRRLDL